MSSTAADEVTSLTSFMTVASFAIPASSSDGTVSSCIALRCDLRDCVLTRPKNRVSVNVQKVGESWKKFVENVLL